MLSEQVTAGRTRLTIRATPRSRRARELADRGDVDDALDLVADEVRRHSAFDAPYFAYRLPDAFLELAQASGRGDEFRELRRWVTEGIGRAVERRLAARPESAGGKAYALPGAMLNSLYEDQSAGYHDVTAEFLKLQDRFSG